MLPVEANICIAWVTMTISEATGRTTSSSAACGRDRRARPGGWGAAVAGPAVVVWVSTPVRITY
jgi:hypothetical protein